MTWTTSLRSSSLPLVLLALVGVAKLEAAENSLRNPGFEEPLEPAWHKRTPEDADRKLGREEGAGRSGNWAAVLENVNPAYTRLRQGHDRSIAVEPGSLLELAAWGKSEMTDDARLTAQIYCMDENDRIRAQPTSRPIHGACDWTKIVSRAIVPQGTAYVMAYLQVRDGVGRVLIDDVELAVQRKPRPRPPVPKVGLLTDLAEDDPCRKSLELLFADGLVVIDPAEAAAQLADCAGALVLYRSGSAPQAVREAVAGFASEGGRVFLDVRSFAPWHGVEATPTSVRWDEGETLRAAMAAGLRVVKRSRATAGFEPGQVMPRASHPEGNLFVLPEGPAIPGLEVLAVAPDGSPGLVRMPVGRGQVVAADVLSLREPYCRHVDAYYKYTPVAGAIGNPVAFGEYYPKKLSYAGVVELARSIAERYPAIRFEDEGPASEDYRIFSLNLGRPQAPLYFLYAAAHGVEWEPGYGLLTFAQRVAEGRMDDAIDLDRVAIKIVPCLNPWGYDHRRRQNAAGVDLNRQGDYRWEEFSGRDSNDDGAWSPGDYDWKGESPFCEPESRTYRAIVEGAENLYCLLDYHGNSSATSNKVGILPQTAREDNEIRALDLRQIANRRLAGRHLLHQNGEETVSQYLLDRVVMGGGNPYLMNTAARNRFGLLIELTAGYGESYGTVLQTDVTCELCRALFLAYPPPE